MNRKELIHEIAQNVEGITQKDVGIVVLELIDVLTEALKTEGKVVVTGLGVFEVKERKERTGTNPNTSERIIIPKANVVRFRPAKGLKEDVK